MRRRILAAAACGMLLTGCGASEAEEHSMIAEITEAVLQTQEPAESAVTASDTTATQSAETVTEAASAGSTKCKTTASSAASATSGAARAEGQKTPQTRTETRSGQQTVQRSENAGPPADPETVPPRTTGTTDTPAVTGKTASAKRTTSKTTQTTAGTTVTTTTEAPQPQDIEGRLLAMPLHEKAEQMIMSSASDEAGAAAAIRRGAGAMCLFAGAFSGKSPAAVQQMTARLQTQAKTPVLIAVDEEGGPVNRVSLNPQLRSAPFRNSRVIYDEGGWDALRADAAEKADLLLSLGINVNLGPVCDVPVDPSNYIYSRTFGMDPLKTSDYAGVVVSEAKAHGLGTVLKHFPGYGGSIDTHQFMAYDTRNYSAFTESDFLPFSAGISAGADAVMVSHNIVTCMDGEHPASLSPEVHRILREELGFQGVIMTDDLGMGAISLYTGGQNAAVTAVLAGNDIVTFANDAASADAIVSAVESGLISEEQINSSVRRILLWKQSLGLIE